MPNLPTHAQSFLASLEAYIDARIERSNLQFQRLHDGPRAALTAECDEKIDKARSDLSVGIDGLLRAARQKGI